MARYEFDRTGMEGNSIVNSIEYAPNGTDHRLQRRITELLDSIAKENKQWTLAELGYLHINTLLFDQETGQVQLKIYFDVHYAARLVSSKVNGKKELTPVDELNAFEKYLFVGPLTRAVTFEKIMAPKSKMIEDEKKRASLRFKDDAKLVETDCLVLNCDLPITMAAMHDISLMDPQFKVSCSTVGAGGKDKKKTIITSGAKRYVPLRVTVTAGNVIDGDGEPAGYDPEEAVPYLKASRERVQKANQNRDKLAEKARDKAEKHKNAGIVRNRKAFNKFS